MAQPFAEVLDINIGDSEQGMNITCAFIYVSIRLFARLYVQPIPYCPSGIEAEEDAASSL